MVYATVKPIDSSKSLSFHVLRDFIIQQQSAKRRNAHENAWLLWQHEHGIFVFLILTRARTGKTANIKAK